MRGWGQCVLTFHRVLEACERAHDVTWGSLVDILDRIVEDGTPVDAQLAAEDAHPRPSVVLTFDDSTADHLRVGEELARRRLGGIFFVPAGLIGVPGHLSLAEVRALHGLGHTIGSHSVRHARLDRGMTPAQIRGELADSKRRLEDAVGARIRYFAPPGGYHHHLGRDLFSCGYAASRSMRWGFYASPRDRWHIPCIPVTQFTVARGWVAGAVRAWTLPPAMRWAGAVKRVLPESVRVAMRKKLIHAR